MSPTGVALDRAALAALVREHLLDGHLIDRAGMPLLLAHVSTDVMAEVAIEEWRGASPVYTRRMQELLGFRGDDVTTIFKGMQLDIGAPPQFLDFRYRVDDRDHGEFWLAHCGALADVEPMGEELVHAMCHTIEDPTFPATATATNARARVEPIHRPPRRPADRHPHCHWRVVIDPEADPEPEPVEAARMATTAAASLALAEVGAVEEGAGRRWYDGPLEDDVDLGAFSAPVLHALDDEVCLQGHLLMLSFGAAVRARLGEPIADQLARGQLIGTGAVAADRLRTTFDLGDDLEAVAGVLGVHPALLPASYTGVQVEPVADAVLVHLRDAPAQHETVARSWPALLVDDPEPLAAIAQAVNPRARVEPVDPAPGAVASLAVRLVGDPAPEPPEVTLTRFSTGSTFQFEDR